MSGPARSARRAAIGLLIGLACWGLGLGAWTPAVADQGDSAPQTPATAQGAPAQAITPGTLQVRSLPDDPGQRYFLYVPRKGGAGTPVFVSVHGISRNAEEHARAFMPLAERYGVVLVAPLFPETRYPDYQRLGRAGRGERADYVLERIIGEVARLTGARADKVYLFGYSGGGQFVHRFTLAHPERVAAVAVGAAGWYTFPDPTLKYPLGIKRSKSLPDVRFDPERFLRVPACVLVGERDVHRHSILRQSEAVDEYQGTTRVERGEQWVEAMTAAARARGLDTRYAFQTYPRSAHSFARSVKRGKIHQLAFTCLFGPAPAGEPASG